jgi:hypothetical protein
MSSPVSRGFRHLRRPSSGEEGRVPPGPVRDPGLPRDVGRPDSATPLTQCRAAPRPPADRGGRLHRGTLLLDRHGRRGAIAITVERL